MRAFVVNDTRAVQEADVPEPTWASGMCWCGWTPQG